MWFSDVSDVTIYIRNFYLRKYLWKKYGKMTKVRKTLLKKVFTGQNLHKKLFYERKSSFKEMFYVRNLNL